MKKVAKYKTLCKTSIKNSRFKNQIYSIKNCLSNDGNRKLLKNFQLLKKVAAKTLNIEVTLK